MLQFGKATLDPFSAETKKFEGDPLAFLNNESSTSQIESKPTEVNDIFAGLSGSSIKPDPKPTPPPKKAVAVEDPFGPSMSNLSLNNNQNNPFEGWDNEDPIAASMPTKNNDPFGSFNTATTSTVSSVKAPP